MTRLPHLVCFTALTLFATAAFAQTRPISPPVNVQIPPAGQAVRAPENPARPAGGTTPIVQPVIAAPGNPQAVLPPMPQQPEWAARMTADEHKWIDDVLRFWEARSDKIKIFECKFQKWDYENGWVNPANNQRRERTYAEGTIKYAQPDKGLFHVERLVSILPPQQPGGKPQEIEQAADLGEHWICDGQKIYSFEANKKQVTVTPLPAEMRGKAIADGPLPFMFGARAETIKARYWVHGLAADKPGQYKLEAAPKSREDAQNFRSVIIVLNEADYLPESLQIFAPNYDPPRNDARQTYLFAKREAKDEATLADMVARNLDPFGLMRRDFFDPKIPFGWKKVEQNGGGVPAGPPPQQAAPPARQAPVVR
jgi:TIGR03009 family protein